MESLLSFFSDMILFTAGVLVGLFWIVIIIAAIIEVSDNLRGKGESTTLDESEEEYY